MKKINRSDIMTAIERQLNCLPDSMNTHEGMLMLSETVQAIVDISRPSKVPYSDYKTGNIATAGIIIPVKAGYRFVLLSCRLANYNLATGTGTQCQINITVNGLSYAVIMHTTPASVVNNQYESWFGELLCDEGTTVDLATTGTYDVVTGGAAGYYVRA